MKTIEHKKIEFNKEIESLKKSKTEFKLKMEA